MAPAAAWRRFRGNRLAVLGLVVVVLELVLASIAPLVTSYGPGELGPHSRQAPSLSHWFGTDLLGRDLFTRVVYGARVSLRVGLTATAIALSVGIAVGVVAGFYRRSLDSLLMRTTDVLLGFPHILAAIAIISVVGPGEWTVVGVVGLLGWMPVARLVRTGVLQVKALPYVETARAVGCGDLRILLRHVLPNAIQPTIVYASMFVGGAILAEAALSFLGLGATEGHPSWGLLVAQGKDYLSTSPHLLFFPGAALFVTVVALVFIGDGLRHALDPRP